MTRNLLPRRIASDRGGVGAEGSICREYDDPARGGAILSFWTPTPEDRRRACHILTAYGAPSMLHFVASAIADVAAGEGCSP